MVWGVKGPGQVEGREAGKPGSPDPRIPGSREAEKPKPDPGFQGAGGDFQTIPICHRVGRGFKVFEGAGRAAGGSDTTPESPRSAHVLRHTPR